MAEDFNHHLWQTATSRALSYLALEATLARCAHYLATWHFHMAP